MDETSLHAWLTKKKTWQLKYQPIPMAMQSSRGCSMTVIGLIGGDPFDSFFELFRKTNKESVLCYLDAFINTHY
jgi:hypothetical protein